MIRTSLLTLLFASLAFGCGKKDEGDKSEGKKDETTQPKAEDKPAAKHSIEGMMALVDKMCACEDKACFEKVEDEAEKAYPKDVVEKLLKENPQEAEKMMTKIMECASKLDPAEPTEAPATEEGDAPAPGAADAGAE